VQPAKSNALSALSGNYRPSLVFSVCVLFIAGSLFWRVPELRDFHLRQPLRP
jgi:hypothetical protein